MSIATELTLLANSKQAIKNSINQKGGNITDSTPLADYSTAIDNLPSGGGDNSTLIDLIERDITSINIPSGVTKIGTSAFAYCRNLASITLPNTVTEIASQAFNSSVITAINIPSSVTTIAGAAFYECGRLARVDITDLSAWCNIAFGDNSSITNPLQAAHHLYLNGTEITNLVIPNDITEVKNRTFQGGSNFTSLTLHDGITAIGNYAFYECDKIKSLTLPNSITKIGVQAFYDSGLTGEVIIPNSVTELGYNAFSNTGITSFIINNTTPIQIQQYQNPFNESGIIYVPAESLNLYRTATGWSAFKSRIMPLPFKLYASDSNSATSVSCDNSTTLTSSEMIFDKTDYSIGECVTSVGNNAFGGTERSPMSISTIFVPDNVTSIGDGAFQYLSGPTITFESSTPPTFGTDVFTQLDGETLTIYVPEDAVDAYKAVVTPSSYADSVQPYPSYKLKYRNAFGVYFKSCDGNATLTSAEVPKDSTQIEIGDCVTTLGDSSLASLLSVAELNIPDSVTNLGRMFCSYNKNMNVTISANATTIGDYCFYNCSNITLTCLATTPPTIGSNPANMYAFNVIYVPAESVNAYKQASRWNNWSTKIQAIPAE